MYITDTTNKVIELFNDIENIEDISKIKFILYTFERFNNNQINDTNEINPDLIDNENLNIFNMELLGFPSNYCTIFLEYNVMLYQQILQTKDVYEDNGNIIGIEYDKTESKIISDFEQLSYNEKLDIFSELFIRYDNETYFKNKITMMTFDSKRNDFELAREIKKQKTH